MKKKGATIKISGVRVNPLAWLEPEQQPEVEDATPELEHSFQTELKQQHSPEQEQQPLELEAESQQPSLEVEQEQPLAGDNQTALPEQAETEVLAPSEPETESESESQFVQLVDDDEVEEGELPAAVASTTILPQEEEMLKSSTDPLTISDESTTTTGVTACPMHAHMVVPGHCECMRGYELNPESNRCELPVEMAASPGDSTVLESPSHHTESSRSI